MNEDGNGTEPGRLRGLRPASPPAALRGQVLASARQALSNRSASRDLWARIVASRIVRLAWAAAVVALVLAHVAISLPRRVAGSRSAAVPILASTAEPDLLEDVRLSRIDRRAARSIGAELPQNLTENGS